MNRVGRWLGTSLIAAVLVATVATPAAAVTAEQKLAALSDFTQTSTGSYNAWNAARLNQPAWAEYGFNWSTDLCSSSPDNPLGFDFRLPCHRHDFGYRNYKEMGRFSAHKARVDLAFYDDLKRKCVTYHWAVRGACYSLAWTYYKAVRNFGAVIVSQADIDRAAEQLPY